VSKLRVLQTVQKLHPTTVRDIAAKLDLSTTTVYHHLQTLKEEKAVTWEAGKARTIRPV
jgi:DNA-binding IclR family transcriptional regulator